MILAISLFLYACSGEDTQAPPLPPVNTETPDTGKTPIDSNTQIQIPKKEASDVCLNIDSSQSNCEPFLKELLDALQTHRYRSEEYVKVNKGKPYPTVLSSSDTIDVYVNAENYSEFAPIDPDISASFLEVSPGTTIIREVWSNENKMKKFTGMIKMERGYFPEGGDFAYLVLKADGTITKGGKLNDCAECHITRPNDGFLFGVKKAYKHLASVEQRLATIASDTVANKLHYDSALFTKINKVEYPSRVDSENVLDIYVSQIGVADYLNINPDSPNDPASPSILVDVPEETVIVREFKSPASFTVMVKGPKGFFPEGGDFYYALLDEEGEAVGAPEKTMEDCASCHKDFRSQQAFMFGVPRYVRFE